MKEYRDDRYLGIDRTEYAGNTPDKKITEGEMVHAIFSVQNIGEGPAENVAITIDIHDSGVVFYRSLKEDSEGENNEWFVEKLDVGNVQDLSFYFHVPFKYKKDKVSIGVSVTESRGKYGTSMEFPFEINSRISTGEVYSIKSIEANEQDINLVQSQVVDVDMVPENSITELSNPIALIFGVEEYEDPLTTAAKYKLKDAIKFYDYCREVLHIPVENIYFKTGDRATSKALHRALLNENGWLANNVTAGETDVIIYLAGHGFPDLEGNSYFLPYNVKASEKTYAIKLDDVYLKLDMLQPNRAFVFIEACFSGNSGYSGDRAETLYAYGNAPSVVPESMGCYDNMVVITATGGEDLSWNAPDYTHGIFTYYILKALSGGKEVDKNRDKKVTVKELYSYVYDKTKKKAYKTFEVNQKPEICPAVDDLGERGDWVIVEYK